MESNQKQMNKTSTLVHKFIDEFSEMPDMKKISTPLEKAVTHLLRIGSTTQRELQEMAKEFITEEDACIKVGLVYENWLFDQFARAVNTFKNNAQEKGFVGSFHIKFNNDICMTLMKSKAWQFSESSDHGKIFGCSFLRYDNQKEDWIIEARR